MMEIVTDDRSKFTFISYLTMTGGIIAKQKL